MRKYSVFPRSLRTGRGKDLFSVPVFMPGMLFLVFFFVSVSCRQQHLINDPAYLEQVKQDFAQAEELASARGEVLFSVFDGDLTPAEREGMMFLYAYMPLNDLADYDGRFFLEQVRYALRSRREMVWGGKVPEELFLHYVLPCRVNNENLDSFRMVYYDEIRARVEGLSLEEAVLELNHWCHEKVAYQPADIRTSSPMNTVKNARGRCGEESTFTVATLRTAGIPARQVYVPRWAHTDDNHAWVEVWVDGTWHYLGACEPEAVLDLGWFTEPASRAMLVHTKAFGAYRGDEPLVRQEKKFAELNCLHRYTETKEAVVRVTDSTGRPVRGATVDYRLYNYSEFYPLASLSTDSDGCTVFTTGLGDLLVWAHKGDLFGYGKMRVALTDTLEIRLGDRPDTETRDLDLVPPAPRKAEIVLSEQQKEENGRRLLQEDSLRMAYTATFFDSVRAAAWAVEHGYPVARCVPLLVKSMGNHATITAFLEQVDPGEKEKALLLLENLSDKDLRDVVPAVLQDHLENAPPPRESFAGYGRYLLSPRVANEQLTPYRAFFREHFTEEERRAFREDPEKIQDWINRNIRLDEADNYYGVPLTPPGVCALGLADRHSRMILFVALCRTVGIPARLAASRDVVQYLHDGRWKDVFLAGDPVLPGCTARLTLRTSRVEEPAYYVQFTLGRFREGVYHTLEFPFQMKASSFTGMPMDPGDYLLVTGRREESGSVLVRLHFFSLEKDASRTVDLILRKGSLQPQMRGRIAGDFLLKKRRGTETVSLSELEKEGGVILCWIDQRREPSHHLLNELPDILHALEGWPGTMVLLVTGEEARGTFDPERLPGSPGRIVFLQDEGGELLDQVLAASGTGREEVKMPVTVVLSDRGEILDIMEGYRIGFGTHLQQVVMAKNKSH
jgi:hypothetical protein